jgi:hypothetical protein
MKPQGDAGRIAAMAGQWRGAAGRVGSLASGLDGAVPAGWSGSAHAAFAGTWGDLKGQSATAAGAMDRAAGALDALSQALSAAQSQWASAQQLAASNGLVLNDDGTVTGSGKPAPDAQAMAQTVATQADAASLQWRAAQDGAASQFAALSADAATAIHGVLEALHFAVGAASGVKIALAPIMAYYEDATKDAAKALALAKVSIQGDLSTLKMARLSGDTKLWDKTWQNLMDDNKTLTAAADQLGEAAAQETGVGGAAAAKALEKMEAGGVSALDGAAFAATLLFNHYVDHEPWLEAAATSAAALLGGIGGAAAGTAATGNPVGGAVGAVVASAAAQEAVKWIWEHPHQAWEDLVNAAKSVSPYGVAQNLVHGMENWAASLGSML